MLHIVPGETCCLDEINSRYVISHYRFTLYMANELYTDVVDASQL